MECWFTTSDGNTLHNNPATKDYVSGEPPKYPRTSINYREFCLSKGIARAGWPNTGDLRPDHFGEGRLAPDGYSFNSIEETHRLLLRNFASICAGDLIIIPADDGYCFHLGVVLTMEKQFIHPNLNNRPFAYYYYHNIPAGDVYECSHRVNVRWAKDDEWEFSIFEMQGLSGIWQKAGSRIVQQAGKLYQFAQDARLF